MSEDKKTHTQIHTDTHTNTPTQKHTQTHTQIHTEAHTNGVDLLWREAQPEVANCKNRTGIDTNTLHCFVSLSIFSIGLTSAETASLSGPVYCAQKKHNEVKVLDGLYSVVGVPLIISMTILH